MHAEPLPRVVWVVRFVTDLERLGPRTDPALLADRGVELWKANSSRAPKDAALDELAPGRRSPTACNDTRGVGVAVH
jgi:hypothetical protein